MTTLGNYLTQSLKELGVSTLFGIPGDYILDLCHELETTNGFRFIPLSTEPGVGFAAQAFARATGKLGVVCVTYGVGGLSVLNPVACAYAEMAPLLVLSGGPSREEKERASILVHHQVKSPSSQLKIFEEVTQYAAVLDDPATAAQKIDHALECTLQYMKPVYLEIPRGAIHQEIRVPTEKKRPLLTVNEEAVTEAAHEIGDRLSRAKKPVLVVGIEVHRKKLAGKVVRFAEQWGIPVVSTFLARGTYPYDHPQYLGTYLGAACPPLVRETVEKSDCLFMLGVILTDTNMAVRLKDVDPKNVMLCLGREVKIQHHKYENAPLEKVLDRILEGPVQQKARHFEKIPPPDIAPPPTGNGPITVGQVIDHLNYFLKTQEQMIVVADTGDSLFISYELNAKRVMAPAYYTTMGFAVPSGIGIQIGTGERPLILVGDGAFQMTGTELAQCPRYEINPIVILLNNNRWGMLEPFLPEGGYNKIPNWPYAEMARGWGGNGFSVKTPKEFQEALQTAHRSDRFSLIEVAIQPGDYTKTLQIFAKGIKS
ncbi:MAG: indolepyruvate/phenylpyruvate decarboxylase [Deltaproteobacteria bacterium]|nr:indolepyruvate/phenylpyruvate decarboxylase [Deltaproteobacteria bacterium]